METLFMFLPTFLLLAYLIWRLEVTLSTLKSPISVNPALEASDEREEELSSYERERLHREKIFDERIQRLKEELDKQQTTTHVQRQSTPAEELHPMVKNLPHTIIPKDKEPDIEVAE